MWDEVQESLLRALTTSKPEPWWTRAPPSITPPWQVSLDTNENAESMIELPTTFRAEAAIPISRSSTTIRVLALGRAKAVAYASIAHTLSELGEITYRDEKSFRRAVDCIDLVRQWAYDVVVMPNPYGNVRRLEIYRRLREARVPVIAFDRGGLPRSWFFDVGFNADSTSYCPTNWDRPLSSDQRAYVRDYIQRLRTEGNPLEAQGERIGPLRLREKLGIGDRKVLFVPFQRPSDTTARHFCAPMRDYAEFEKLVSQVRELTSTALKHWVVVAKKHPLESERPNSPVTFADDDAHINDLIELADAVLVLNSGTGLLGLCWDKPVLIAGTAYYADRRLNTQVGSVADVRAALLRLQPVDLEIRDRFIHHLISSVYSFGTFRNELVKQADGAWRNITRHIDFDVVRFPALRKRPALLFVTPVIPWPIDRGAAHRTDQILRALSTQDIAVDLLCLNQTEPDADAAELAMRIRQRYPSLRHIMVRRHPKLARTHSLSDIASWISYQLAHLADCLGGRSQTINGFAHCPPSFARYLAGRLQAVPYAAVWFNYLRVLPPNLKTDAKIVCDLHDYQTERIKADVLPKLPVSQRERYLERFRSSEVRALEQCDLAIAISPIEMHRIAEELRPQTRLVSVPATDRPRGFTAQAEPPVEPGYDLLFVGSRSDANIAGICWFLEHCFSRIVAALPHVRLRIHGSITAMPKLTQLVAQLPDCWHITSTGPAESMDEVYASTRIVICPIRHGTGMKIKMIEAMAYGKAIVATSKAGEGLATDLGLEFFDAAADFAETCVRLLNDPDARHRSEQNALATFARDHEQSQLDQKIARILDELQLV